MMFRENEITYTGHMLRILNNEGAVHDAQVQHALNGSSMSKGAVCTVPGGGVLSVLLEEGAIIEGDSRGA